MDRTDWPRLSDHGMTYNPAKRGKRWPLHPDGTIEAHEMKNRNGDSGDHPPGKLPKGRRMKTGAPGSPNGVCIQLQRPGECRCGKHNR